MDTIIVISLIILSVVGLICLITALSKTGAPPDAPKPTSIASTKAPTTAKTPQLRSTVGPKSAPQITVYTNPIPQNAFRCPVCDSKPAPSARQCQVCGQVFHMKGVN